MESFGEKQRKYEEIIRKTDQRIEALKTQFNLFFSGELKIPPEKERETVEKVIREMQSKEMRSGKLEFLLQNLSSRFYLYNNMWLKKLSQLEAGTISRFMQKKGTTPPPVQKTVKTSSVSLNREDTFEFFYQQYDELVRINKGSAGKSKDELINSIKLKMISEYIIDADINLTIDKGKVQIRLKK